MRTLIVITLAMCIISCGALALCPNKPGIPMHGCPDTPMPAGVLEADRAWFRCPHSSMKIQIKQFADPNEAMEAAFSACRAEEDGDRI